MEHSLTITTTGSAGTATGSAVTPTLYGFLEMVRIDYNAMPVTTDITISEVGGLNRTLLTISNSNTDAVYYPRSVVHDAAGVAIVGGYAKIYLYGYPLQVSVAQADAGAEAVKVGLILSPAIGGL